MSSTRSPRMLSIACALFACAPFLSAQMQLAVNKEIKLANGNNLTNSAVGIGVPVYYQIQIIGSVAAGDFDVNDVLPPGFVQTGPVTCTVVSNAQCPAPGTMNPPNMGPFTTTSVGGEIILRIPGFFQTSGPMVNIATATARIGGRPVTSQIQVTVPGSAIPADIKVEKTLFATTNGTLLSSLPNSLIYEITVTNTSTTQDLYLGGSGFSKILKLTDKVVNFTGVTANFSTNSFACGSTNGADCVDAVPASSSAVLPPYTAWTAFVATYPLVGTGWNRVPRLHAKELLFYSGILLNHLHHFLSWPKLGQH